MGFLLFYIFVNNFDFKKWYFLYVSLYKLILRVSYINYGFYEIGFRYKSLLIILVEFF